MTFPPSEILRRRVEIVQLTAAALAGFIAAHPEFSGSNDKSVQESMGCEAVGYAIAAQKEIDEQEGDGF